MKRDKSVRMSHSIIISLLCRFYVIIVVSLCKTFTLISDPFSSYRVLRMLPPEMILNNCNRLVSGNRENIASVVNLHLFGPCS